MLLLMRFKCSGISLEDLYGTTFILTLSNPLSNQCTRTRVVLGIQARELHVCGGLEAAELVENFCKSTGDEFELVNYERLSELQ